MLKFGQQFGSGAPPRSLQPALLNQCPARLDKRVVAKALPGKQGRRELLQWLTPGLVACLANTPNATANAAYVVEEETVRAELLYERQSAEPSTSGRRPDDPPTYVTATGRVVASECFCTAEKGQVQYSRSEP
jgi:hypothetical protein